MRSGLAALLVLWSATAAAQPDAGLLPRRVAHAIRRAGPITIDGRLDEPAWSRADVGTGFTQSEPDEGAPASEATRFRVLWDDEALYFGIECDDDQPPTIRTSRRDRDVDADDVRIDLDTFLDGRTAYHFGVYASGQQVDGVHFNDTDYTSEWDAVWDSAVARTPSGWSVEIRIPWRSLPHPDRAIAFGFNIARSRVRRNENASWQYTPPELPGKVSRFGKLVGFDGIAPAPFLELRPTITLRAIRSEPAPAEAVLPPSLGACSWRGFSAATIGIGCLGLDLRAGIAPDLRLVAALNPDFGEVEVDEQVLNLTTFETFFPEKRPFFLEGMDLFRLPLSGAYQPFYSRRIGAPAPAPDLGANTFLVYAPAARPIATAKLSGMIGSASVAALTAFEPEVFANVLGARGPASESIATPRSLSAVRLRAPAGSNLVAGFMATSADPLGPGRSAQVGVLDLSAFDDARDFTADFQLGGSRLGGDVDEDVRDGTQLHPGSAGWAASTRLARNGGNLVGSISADVLTPSFSVDDLGFMDRANLIRISPSIGVLGLRPNGVWRRASLSLTGVLQRDFAGALDRADLSLDASVLLPSYWSIRAQLAAGLPTFDDRELGDGTPLERRSSLSASLGFGTDARAPVSLDASLKQTVTGDLQARRLEADAEVALRPWPSLETRLGAAFQDGKGEVRRIRAASGVPEVGGDPEQPIQPRDAPSHTRLYLLAPQSSRSISLTFRATAAFSPRVSLQAFAQLFTAGIVYGPPLRAVEPPGRAAIHLDQLAPASPRDRAPDADSRDASLALNLILRWEWRRGSTLSLVYARNLGNSFTPADRDLSLRSQIGALAAEGAAGSDTFLLKLDVLLAR